MPFGLACDIHTHTLYSQHAYSTISENVTWAAERGLQVLGSADHFSAMTTPAPNDLRSYQFFTNQNIWPRVWNGVMVLRGAEVDIVGLKGELYGQDVPAPINIAGNAFKTDRSLFERVTWNLDYLVASVHDRTFAQGCTTAQATEMYIGALENPKVFVLGHSGRAGVPYDIDEVLTVAKEKHKLIEINNHSLEPNGPSEYVDVCRDIAVRCAELGVGIAVSTDAHIALGVGAFPYALKLLDEIHFPRELIITRDRETLLSEMAAAGVCDLTDLI